MSMYSFALPTAAVILEWPQISGEAESGTALAILSRPMGRSEYVIGKWLGLAALVAIYAGGAAAIEALAAPFVDVSFVPTGGVGPGNLAEYLAIPAVVAVGGSWMVPRDLVNSGAFAGTRPRGGVGTVLGPQPSTAPAASASVSPATIFKKTRPPCSRSSVTWPKTYQPPAIASRKETPAAAARS